MNDIKEKTTLNTPTAIGDGQSSQICTTNSITDNNEDFKDFEESFREMQKEMLRQMDPSYLKTVSLSGLYETDFEPQEALIDSLLYRGAYLFIGSPKVGKSFMMAQLAYHISTGTDLWGYKVRKGKVLYLALEDDYQRLQKRLYRMFGANCTEDLYFSVSAGQITGSLDDQLNRFMQKNPNTKLIIIDTLQKVKKVGVESYSYANEYEIMTKLEKFADNNGICLLLVHHTRKQNADDAFETNSGTNGLLGAADGAFILSKEKEQTIKQHLKFRVEINRIRKFI